MAQHQLQRLASPARSVSLLFHIIGLSSFTYSFYFLTTWKNPLAQAYGWHFQFLTIIGLSIASIAFIFAALADLTGSSGLFRAKNAVAVIATPLAVVITILYWGLCLIDPNLVKPPGIRLPLPADISFHMAPAVLSTLDLVLFSPPWTIPAYGVMALSTAFAFGYWYWVELCFSKNGWYPYPIFALLDTTQRILLFTFSAGLVTASSTALKWIYGKVNGYEKAQREAHLPLKKVE